MSLRPGPDHRDRGWDRNLVGPKVAGRRPASGIAPLAGCPPAVAAGPANQADANHVLYFWHDPALELAQLHSALGGGGFLALGYQLRQNVPNQAQANFPKRGLVAPLQPIFVIRAARPASDSIHRIMFLNSLPGRTAAQAIHRAKLRRREPSSRRPCRPPP